MKYNLYNDDILLLKHVENLLRKNGENQTANDVDLFRRRIETMIKQSK